MKLLMLLFLLPLTALGTTWDEYLTSKKAIVSHESHLPYRLTHGHKTSKSVLLIHGIFSSPLYFKGMAEKFYNAGHNVVTILLPGHWERADLTMKKITTEDWTRETDIGFELASELGDEVILAGHSLGGLLSVEQTLKRENSNIHSLVLISPSLKVRKTSLISGKLGDAIDVSGNAFLFKRANGVTIPYMDPKAAALIQSLANKVLVKPLTTPVFMAYTKSDFVVNVRYLKKYFKALTGPKELMTFGIFKGILHGDIGQGPNQEFAYGTNANPQFETMMNNAIAFIERQPK